MGVIAGVTTNPSLIAKEGRDYATVLKEIAEIVDGPISGEVKATTEDAEGMIAEGRAIYALDPKHMVVKIPMTVEGLKAIKVLSSEGIPTNSTLIFSAKPGTAGSSCWCGPMSVPSLAVWTISPARYRTDRDDHRDVLPFPGDQNRGYLRFCPQPIHVTDCALAGADIATVPYKVIEQMTHHPLTDQGIVKFQEGLSQGIWRISI